MNNYLTTLLILFGLINCQSKVDSGIEESKKGEETTSKYNEKIVVEIHARVDTNNSEIKEVAELWINYLNSVPDIISDNPNWNIEEKSLYKDFDLSRSLLYQFPSNQLLNYFRPKILSIEKEGENYGIRTIFSADGLEGDYRKSNPFCILKIYAVKEKNEWKLKNALPIITSTWSRETYGKITFIYPQHHTFNQGEAEKAIQFCNKVANEFNFPEWEPFDFYITLSGDELGKLLNFDFFFTGYATGIGFNDNRMLLSGLGSEYYPHEFIHLIIPKFKRHSLIEEGFATWKGGQGGKSFEESARLLANELARNDTVTFLDILEKKWGWEVAAFYTSGAIICQSAYEKGGVEMVNSLLKIENNNSELVENISKIFGMNPVEFDAFWRQEVLRFKNK